MNSIEVKAGTDLFVTYSWHQATKEPASNFIVVAHHGICHTREQFAELITELNALGLHVAMVDQQTANAPRPNRIGIEDYCTGLYKAVERIRADHRGLQIGSYVLHSMGALIGEVMQLDYPQFRRPTVLMAPIPPRLGALPVSCRLLLRRPRDFLRACVRQDIVSLAQTDDHVRDIFFDKKTDPEVVASVTGKLQRASFWSYLQLVFPFPLAPRTFGDGLPKLLLTSESDQIFKPGQYKRMPQRYSDLETSTLPGGHDFFIEHAHPTALMIQDFHARHQDVAARIEAEYGLTLAREPHYKAATVTAAGDEPER